MTKKRKAANVVHLAADLVEDRSHSAISLLETLIQRINDGDLSPERLIVVTMQSADGVEARYGVLDNGLSHDEIVATLTIGLRVAVDDVMR